MKDTFVTVSQKQIKHVEGDVWEESGKLWTIKNGIKRTISKMDHARKEFSTPLACPKCGSSMKHHLDEKMWAIHKTCFNCVIDMEHEIMKTGKWEEYEKTKMLANANSYFKEMEDVIKEFTKEHTTKAHVTEDGLVERWKDVSKDRLEDVSEIVKTEMTNALEIIKNKVSKADKGDQHADQLCLQIHDVPGQAVIAKAVRDLLIYTYILHSNLN